MTCPCVGECQNPLCCQAFDGLPPSPETGVNRPLLDQKPPEVEQLVQQQQQTGPESLEKPDSLEDFGDLDSDH